ncbi:MAG: hypothetical protein FWE80_00575 [Oscillospiraceae bacterium]|nr:hypothetical protein [Oscillospiraceae bacterium]
MDVFSLNQTEFPSAIHHAIWNIGRLMFPLAWSLAGIADEQVRQACADLYHYVRDGYADMYDHPEAYGLNPEETDAFLAGRPWSKANNLVTVSFPHGFFIQHSTRNRVYIVIPHLCIVNKNSTISYALMVFLCCIRCYRNHDSIEIRICRQI